MTTYKVNSSSQRTRRRSERGDALVETAIVIPLWVILFYGLVELAFMAKTYAAMVDAAKEGLNVATAFTCYLDHNCTFNNDGTFACNDQVGTLKCPMNGAGVFRYLNISFGRTTFAGGSSPTPPLDYYFSCLDNNTFVTPDSPSQLCGEILIASRARLALDSLNPRITNGSNGAQISVFYNQGDGSANSPKRVSVTLSGTYVPVLKLYGGMTIQTTQTAVFGMVPPSQN